MVELSLRIGFEESHELATLMKEISSSNPTSSGKRMGVQGQNRR
jgi:hypothetical protein